MRYFLDTEFIEHPGKVSLISIGIVSEDNRNYYRISNEYNYYAANDWVHENVIKPMYLEFLKVYHGSELTEILGISNFQQIVGTSHERIASEILDYIDVDKYGIPEFWGYFSDYDWVAFCGLFGNMANLPKHFPKYCLDIKQEMYLHNIPRIDDSDNNHNALDDAKWHKQMFDYVQQYKKEHNK